MFKLSGGGRGRGKGCPTTKDCKDATDVDDATSLTIFLGKELRAKILMQITFEALRVKKMTKRCPRGSDAIFYCI